MDAALGLRCGDDVMVPGGRWHRPDRNVYGWVYKIYILKATGETRYHVLPINCVFDRNQLAKLRWRKPNLRILTKRASL